MALKFHPDKCSENPRIFVQVDSLKFSKHAYLEDGKSQGSPDNNRRQINLLLKSFFLRNWSKNDMIFVEYSLNSR